MLLALRAPLLRLRAKLRALIGREHGQDLPAELLAGRGIGRAAFRMRLAIILPERLNLRALRIGEV